MIRPDLSSTPGRTDEKRGSGRKRERGRGRGRMKRKRQKQKKTGREEDKRLLNSLRGMTGTRRAAASVGMAKWQLEIEEDNKIIIFF